ncbi:MAG TPA: class I SAM-dependent methyltransferase [Nocardioidaceae bacterium]|nr:class I SAM-dependent methyltransferase [Nocardioidaceae bacterium]
MDESLRTRRARAFGGVAEVYERTRPDYPEEAVRWMVGSAPGRVLELGAGTGKMTARLVAQGHQVVATDPAAPMLEPLRKRVAAAWTVQSTAERIPLLSSSVDAVVAGQAFHWFDAGNALEETARVLRPAGTLALVWNLRDETVPWVRRLGRLIGSEQPEDPTELLEGTGLFDGVEHKTFRHWQEVHRDSLVGLVESRSAISELPDRERADVLAKVGDLYDDYGRGPDGMLLPYLCHAYRCRVSGLANFRRDQEAPLDDGLLIDFS